MILPQRRSPWLLLAITSSSSSLHQSCKLRFLTPYLPAHSRRISSSSSSSLQQQHEDDSHPRSSSSPPRPLTLAELGLDEDRDASAHGSSSCSFPSYVEAEETRRSTSRRPKEERIRRLLPKLGYGNGDTEGEQEDGKLKEQRRGRFQAGIVFTSPPPPSSLSSVSTSDPASASERKVTPEEMKQAALDAARIIAGIAGIKLSSSSSSSSSSTSSLSQRSFRNSKSTETQDERYGNGDDDNANTGRMKMFLSKQTSASNAEEKVSLKMMEDDVEEEEVLETSPEDNAKEDEDAEEEDMERWLEELSENEVDEQKVEDLSVTDNVSAVSSDISTATRKEVKLLEEGSASSSTPKFSHPWPEWMEFLEELHARGSFKGTEDFVEDGKHLFDSYTAVRHAACVFARERTDIFRSLKRKDLRTLANCSCPDLERKTSNASKRLRDHFNIAEGEVCMNCKLKMSCSRAFLTPSQALAVTTLDVLRVITGFATNAGTFVSDVAERNECPSEVQAAVCRLLSEILILSKLPKGEESPVESHLKSKQAKEERQKSISSFSVPDKPGDWVCPNCDFMNFNRNRRCKECHVCRPPQEQEALLGDWTCSKCWYLNFSRNRYCRECNAERPTKIKWAGGEEFVDEDVFNKPKNGKTRGSDEDRKGHRRQNLQSSRVETSDSEADDPRFISKQKAAKMKRVKAFDELEADESRVATKRMDKNRDKNPRREKQMEKFAEKDYEASEEEGSFNESSLSSSVAHYSESEIDFADEENRAQKHGSRKMLSKKVPQVLFNWSDDDDDEEEKSSRALSKKVKPSKPKGKKKKNVKSRR